MRTALEENKDSAESMVVSRSSSEKTQLSEPRAREELRVLMAAGGTGGHIYPALAVAEELTARSREQAALAGGGSAIASVQFLGTDRGLESRVIPAAGFKLRTVRAAGLKGIGGWKKLVNLMVLPVSAIETAAVLREFQPQVVVGIGGYLAGPAMLEAAMKDIPTVLIEPNAVPGFTNRLLAPVVRLAAVGFKEAGEFYGDKARVTGHAVRKAFFQAPAKAHHPPFTILIVGGSQGARAINQCMIESLPELARESARLRIIHQSGKADYNILRAAYDKVEIDAEVHDYIDDVAGALAQADLAVSRAGATAVAELAASGRASILVPFPGAADQHQLENARALERAKAALLIEQRFLTPARLVGELRNFLDHPEMLAPMELAAKSLARPDAAKQIADLVEGLAR